MRKQGNRIAKLKHKLPLDRLSSLGRLIRAKIYWVLGGLLLCLVLLYAYGRGVTAVEIATVSRGEVLHIVTDTGYVQAADKIDLYAAQGGTVKSLPVSVGAPVSKGQVLLVLENQETAISVQQLQIQLSQATAALSAARAGQKQSAADLADARAQWQRAQELFSAGALSRVDYDAVKSLLAKAELSADVQEQTLQLAQAQASNYQSMLRKAQDLEQKLQITSPIDGVLMQLLVKQEQVVTYGALLATVSSAADLEIKADILSDDLAEVQVGQTVQITAPVLNDTVLSGVVSVIYPQAEEVVSALGVAQRRVPVIIKLAAVGNLKPGYETKINIVTASRSDVLIVPREAVVTDSAGQSHVMTVERGRVKYKAVETGLADTKNIEIVQGLGAGDRIVKDASANLAENARVKAK